MRRESGGKTKKEINVIVELKAERFNEDSEQFREQFALEKLVSVFYQRRLGDGPK